MRSVSAVEAGVGDAVGRTASWAEAKLAMANSAAAIIRNFFMDKFFKNHWCVVRVVAALTGARPQWVGGVHGDPCRRTRGEFENANHRARTRLEPVLGERWRR